MKRHGWLFLSLAITGVGAVPLVAYYALVARVPSVTPGQLRDRLGGDAVALVDIRDDTRFQERRLPGAIRIPSDRLMAGQLTPEEKRLLNSKDVFVICESGLTSARAAAILRARGVKAFNVSGGMAACVAAGRGFCLPGANRGPGATAILEGPYHPASAFEQWAVVVSAFGMKPAYMLLSLILAVVLFRRPSPDLRAMAWAMLFFFLGESFCAANYLFTEYHDSFVLEYLHGFGMLLCFGFSVFALFEGIDRRLIHVSDPDRRCAATALCEGCSKHQPIACGLQRVFLFVGLAVAVVAWIPWSLGLRAVSYNTEILGTLYNYAHPTVFQLYEMRYFPLIGSLSFLIGALVLHFKREAPIESAKVFYAAGAGALGFALLRFGLFSAFRDNLIWMDFWEETTELLFILGVLFVLWVFRDSLLGRRDGSASNQPATETADAIHTH